VPFVLESNFHVGGILKKVCMAMAFWWQDVYLFVPDIIELTAFEACVQQLKNQND
jgi:hypothetical protein